jgi:hypothetical protein
LTARFSSLSSSAARRRAFVMVTRWRGTGASMGVC